MDKTNRSSHAMFSDDAGETWDLSELATDVRR